MKRLWSLKPTQNPLSPKSLNKPSLRLMLNTIITVREPSMESTHTETQPTHTETQPTHTPLTLPLLLTPATHTKLVTYMDPVELMLMPTPMLEFMEELKVLPTSTRLLFKMDNSLKMRNGLSTTPEQPPTKRRREDSSVTSRTRSPDTDLHINDADCPKGLRLLNNDS